MSSREILGKSSGEMGLENTRGKTIFRPWKQSLENTHRFQTPEKLLWKIRQLFDRVLVRRACAQSMFSFGSRNAHANLILAHFPRDSACAYLLFNVPSILASLAAGGFGNSPGSGFGE